MLARMFVDGFSSAVHTAASHGDRTRGNWRAPQRTRGDFAHDDARAEREQDPEHGRAGRPPVHSGEGQHALHDDAAVRVEDLKAVGVRRVAAEEEADRLEVGVVVAALERVKAVALLGVDLVAEVVQDRKVCGGNQMSVRAAFPRTTSAHLHARGMPNG